MYFFNKKRIKKKNYKLKASRGFTPLETGNFNKFFDLFKMKNFKKDKNNKTKFLTGFTLIETFVAITVLIISIVGPFTLVMKSLAVSKATKGQITAMYLAQEAVEYTRNIRDENILTGNNWLMDLRECVGEGSKCKMNTPQHREVTSCGVGDCPPLKFHPTTKIYGYDDGGDSVFIRTVEINEITTNIEVIITVTMKWQEGPRERDFVVTEHLLNWQ